MGHFKCIPSIIHINRSNITPPGPHDQYRVTTVTGLQVQGTLTSEEIIPLPPPVILTSYNDRETTSELTIDMIFI